MLRRPKAVPFTWEERPGKPRKQQSSKVTDLQPCAGTGAADLTRPGNKLSLPLQQLFWKERSCGSGSIQSLAPPPRLQTSTILRVRGMSNSSSSDVNGSSSFSASDSPDDEYRGYVVVDEAPSHSRARSVTLLDLMTKAPAAPPSPARAANGNSTSPKTNTLEQLFKLDSRKENGTTRALVMVRPHRAASDSCSSNSPAGAGVGIGRRRTSYLPYKQGLLSIFCMSPHKNGLVPAISYDRHR